MSTGFPSPPHAHAVRPDRPSVARSIRDAMLPAALLTPLPDRDEDVSSEIIRHLLSGPLYDFDIQTRAVVSDAGVEGRVIVRFDGKVRSLATIEASLTAILLRPEPALRGHELFADAFCLAATQAENKVDAVHAWSRGIRPTDGDEG